MVDISGKPDSERTATAEATVLLGPTAFECVRDNAIKKGDVLAGVHARNWVCVQHGNNFGQHPVWMLIHTPAKLMPLLLKTAVARLAGIMGAKQTSNLIPLCHNINIKSVR